MSVIYSAGQYDDAFCPRKLGNWEAGAKEACTYKFRKFYPGITEIIADSRGHLLPGIPRNKSQAWGLLSEFMQNKYSHSIKETMAMMSGPGRQCSTTALLKFKKIPKFNTKKEPPPEEQDLLLEYLQDLCLPIVWIIGPPTKNTFQKRKQFAKQLATKLGFGYVNLDEKIQEWKDRQTSCTCPHPHPPNVRSACSTAQSHHSLASTSIAPSKLPTNVSPKISSELPVPPDTPKNQQYPYSLTMLDSQRIAFDTALPIERNKILELYKFAMAECLPCAGFIMDMVPFDLVEGLAFEKVFYPAALAIYFTEGVPQKKNVKPKDRRVTATACSSTAVEPKFLRNPNDPKTKKIPENQFMKMRSHKRLGTFTLTEGEKICKQFGPKTIRIVNAEDVEQDTMEFLNELVRRNLEKYERILNGEDELDIEQEEDQLMSDRSENAPPSSTYSAFIPEGRQMDELDVYEEERQVVTELQNLGQTPVLHSCEEKSEFLVGPGTGITSPPSGISNLPPALVTANHSETSLINFSTEHNVSTMSSMSSTAVEEDHLKSYSIEDEGAAGDRVVDVREGSAELWEKIVKLETKVAEVSPEEDQARERCQRSRTPSVPSRPPSMRKGLSQEDRLPPPTAFAEQEDENMLTTAIRKAMVPNFVPQERLLPKLRSTPPPPPAPEYDYGAGGDCGNIINQPRRISSSSPIKAFPLGKAKPPSQQSQSSEHGSTGSRRSQPSPKQDDHSFDR